MALSRKTKLVNEQLKKIVTEFSEYLDYEKISSEIHAKLNEFGKETEYYENLIYEIEIFLTARIKNIGKDSIDKLETETKRMNRFYSKKIKLAFWNKKNTIYRGN